MYSSGYGQSRGGLGKRPGGLNRVGGARPTQNPNLPSAFSTSNLPRNANTGRNNMPVPSYNSPPSAVNPAPQAGIPSLLGGGGGSGPGGGGGSGPSGPGGGNPYGPAPGTYPDFENLPGVQNYYNTLNPAWDGTPVEFPTGLAGVAPMVYPGTLDSMNYPTWPDPSSYPVIPGSTWGTPSGNNTPAYLYGVPAPTQQQMQNFSNNAMPVTERPGNDLYYSLKENLGRTPTAAETQRAAVNNSAAGLINEIMTNPIYQRVGPGGLTVGQQKIMNLQKGGLLPKDLLI